MPHKNLIGRPKEISDLENDIIRYEKNINALEVYNKLLTTKLKEEVKKYKEWFVSNTKKIGMMPCWGVQVSYRDYKFSKEGVFDWESREKVCATEHIPEYITATRTNIESIDIQRDKTIADIKKNTELKESAEEKLKKLKNAKK